MLYRPVYARVLQTSTPLTSRRYASNLPEPSSRSSTLPMPPSMPREDYASQQCTLSPISVGSFALSCTEHSVSAALPFCHSRAYISTSSEFCSLHHLGHRLDRTHMDGKRRIKAGQAGRRAGQISRLGYKARHALRGAWICQEWGAGGSRDSIGRSIHPDFRGMIGAKINTVDRGYELAEEYIELAISQAKNKGLRFPPTSRPCRPAHRAAFRLRPASSKPTQQRRNCYYSRRACGAYGIGRLAIPGENLYEQVLASCHASGDIVKSVRLAGKIGDLALRTGEDGMVWYSWGLERAGVTLPAAGLGQTIKQEVQEVVRRAGSAVAVQVKAGTRAIRSVSRCRPFGAAIRHAADTRLRRGRHLATGLD